MLHNLISGFKSSRMFFIVFGLIMYLIETFYPLGEIIHNNFGTFGDFIGSLLVIFFWISIGWKIYDKIRL